MFSDNLNLILDYCAFKIKIVKTNCMIQFDSN